MHHFIYPTQDAYISNKSSELDENFGLDEMLVVGVSQSYSKVVNPTKTYTYSNEYVAGMSVSDFTGVFTGSAYLYSATVNGTLVGGTNVFSIGYFSGSLSASISGFETGSSVTNVDYSGSLTGFTGSINAYFINGIVTGSVISNCFSTFTGTLTDATGSLTGYLDGSEIKVEQNVSIVNRKFINRSLLKFDLSFVSQSIVSGNITNPKFFLKMFITEARELPVQYKVFAFPVSQNWVQGDGYWSDGGSDEGVSWNWRNKNSGSAWFSPYRTDIITSSVDYLNDYSYVSESFMRGGGTWYNTSCSQSFDYESSDLNLDLTNIVNGWLNQSIPNEGLILMCSEETNPSGSNAHLFFFSRETNTIYSPHLDIAWDDQIFITGSFGTGSITIQSYPSGLSGSMTSSIAITDIVASGSFSGNSYLIIDSFGVINSGSSVLSTGLSETIKGLSLNGFIIGTSSVEIDDVRYITASFYTGDFTGCEIFAEVRQSSISGWLSGSFNEMLFINHGISGSISTDYEYVSVITQNSPASGRMIGSVSSSTDSAGVFNGTVIDGLLKGATVSIPFTGSYSYLTSSYSFTSSVVITGSSFTTLNTEKPFVITVQNLKKEYDFGDNPRINVFAREKMPLKTFEKAPQQNAYVITKLLPSSSYYAIKDNETEEFVVDFDNYTKISCDLEGHYFDLNTSALEKERTYRVLVRVDCLDGNSYTFDNNSIFKIRR